ncbi:unnamed protein product [Ilex paraguariensis]|uniref:PORR domain-containing protein n=1 Tax=Ilex paraguariensis TaxID=185542 RepID=A0ABC8UMT6_9AQUA
MTTSKRVQDRSQKKRVHDLEIVTEKHKITSKILFLFEILKQEPEQIIPMKSLDQYRRQINLPKPHKISDFLRKSPKLFELYKDQKGVLWCGMTRIGEELVKEEEKIIEAHQDKAAEYVTRMLMMSLDKRLRLDKIAHFRRDMGLSFDFRDKWVYKYPELFKVVQPFQPDDESQFLELVSWNPSWAVTELEKKVLGASDLTDHVPGLLYLAFPMKFPSNYKKVYRYGGQIDHFQKMEYLSPYADARGLKAGSKEFDKRAVAVMHELLSFTLENRLVTDHLTHFRREFVMPQKLMRLLLKHFGIFYVSERGKRFSVFLNEAYEGLDLVEKCQLVLWKEKVQSLIGYRGKKKKIETFEDIADMDDKDLDMDDKDLDIDDKELDMEDKELFDSDSDNDNVHVKPEKKETVSFEDDLFSDSSEMDIGVVSSAYNDAEIS